MTELGMCFDCKLTLGHHDRKMCLTECLVKPRDLDKCPYIWIFLKEISRYKFVDMTAAGSALFQLPSLALFLITWYYRHENVPDATSHLKARFRSFGFPRYGLARLSLVSFLGNKLRNMIKQLFHGTTIHVRFEARKRERWHTIFQLLQFA